VAKAIILEYNFLLCRVPLEDFDCKLENETKPPAYREDVKEMLEGGRKKKPSMFQTRTGLDYNPFKT